MKKLIAGATVVACMLMGSAAFAKDHDRDEHKGKGPQHRNVRWDRDHDRDHDRRPPGWDKGKKKGWGDCDVPPGQAKKHGCYDRDRHHHHARRVVRRTPTTTVRRDPRPVEGVWRQNKRTSTSPRPTTTQQTTTTTTTTPAPTASNGTWRK
jgi:hypothetical protein